MLVSDSLEAGLALLESANRLGVNIYDKGHLANGYFKKDRNSTQAEILYKEIIGEKPLGWEGQELFLTSYIRLAEIYESRGQFEESISYYEKFLNLWKNGDKAILLKSQIIDKSEQFKIELR